MGRRRGTQRFMQSHVRRRHQAQWHLLGTAPTPDNICWGHWEFIKTKKGHGTDRPKPRNQACIICWQPCLHLPGRGLMHICASHILTTMDRICASVCTCSPVFCEGRRNLVPFLIRLRGRERNQTSLAQIHQWTASASGTQAVNNNNNNINNCCCLFILVNFCDIRMYNNWCMWVDMVALGLPHLSSCIVRLMHLKLLTWGDLQKISNIVIGWLIKRSIDVNICGLFIDWDSYSCLIDEQNSLWLTMTTLDPVQNNHRGIFGKDDKENLNQKSPQNSVSTPYLLMFFAIHNW